MDLYRALRLAGDALFTQAALHGELARVEWAQEKVRLLKMLATILLGYATLLMALLLSSALLLSLSWDTAYRSASVMLLIAVHALATLIAWNRFKTLAAQSARSFAATREELAADLALLRRDP